MSEIQIKRGHSGKGVRLVKKRQRHFEEELTMSLADAADLLFDLKAFLREHPLGKGSIDRAHERRMRREAANASTDK